MLQGDEYDPKLDENNDSDLDDLMGPDMIIDSTAPNSQNVVNDHSDFTFMGLNLCNRTLTNGTTNNRFFTWSEPL
jgi:hypothetical protein